MSNELGRPPGLARPPDPSRPGYVRRHRGPYHEFVSRYREYADLTLRGGWASRKQLTRHLLGFIADERNLAVARDHLERYGGRAPGIDGHTFDMLTAGEWWEGLRIFRDEIRSGGYAPARDLLRQIPKGSGRGTRTIAVQTLTDRVVGRAALQVLQPVLDRFFDPLSFGGRPGRGAFDALAAATHLHERGHTVWVAEDLRDAFSRVPLPRLLDVAAKSLGIKNRRTDRLYAFLKSVVSGASVPGLRQGNPLSPFLMNIFLDHHLDRRWRKAHPRWPLLRYIDDLLVVCPSRAEAREAHAALVEMLVPTGMLTKLGPGRSVRALDARRPVQWLGFAVYRTRAGELRILPGERAWDGLAVGLSEPGLPAGLPVEHPPAHVQDSLTLLLQVVVGVPRRPPRPGVRP